MVANRRNTQGAFGTGLLRTSLATSCLIDLYRSQIPFVRRFVSRIQNVACKYLHPISIASAIMFDYVVWRVRVILWFLFKHSNICNCVCRNVATGCSCADRIIKSEMLRPVCWSRLDLRRRHVICLLCGSPSLDRSWGHLVLRRGCALTCCSNSGGQRGGWPGLRRWRP